MYECKPLCFSTFVSEKGNYLTSCLFPCEPNPFHKGLTLQGKFCFSQNLLFSYRGKFSPQEMTPQKRKAELKLKITELFHQKVYPFTINIKFTKIQLNSSGSNTEDSFTMAVSNSFFSSLEKSHSSRFGIIQGDFFLFILKMVYCVFSLE